MYGDEAGFFLYSGRPRPTDSLQRQVGDAGMQEEVRRQAKAEPALLCEQNGGDVFFEIYISREQRGGIE